MLSYPADMAELADALDLGTSGLPVQVQVLLSAFSHILRVYLKNHSRTLQKQ